MTALTNTQVSVPRVKASIARAASNMVTWHTRIAPKRSTMAPVTAPDRVANR